jgi:S-adenosylmethionine-dependent methyltransferase
MAPPGAASHGVSRPAGAPAAATGKDSGRYAISLSHDGYGVTLLDLSQACLAFARERAAEAEVTLAGYIHGSAVELRQLMSNAYDTVLLMGPLYHLLTPEERQSALREAVRVLSPGGILAARYAPIRDAAAADPAWIVANGSICLPAET